MATDMDATKVQKLLGAMNDPYSNFISAQQTNAAAQHSPHRYSPQQAITRTASLSSLTPQQRMGKSLKAWFPEIQDATLSLSSLLTTELHHDFRGNPLVVAFFQVHVFFQAFFPLARCARLCYALG